MGEKLAIQRESDGAILYLDLVAETLQGGNLIVVQVSPEHAQVLNEIIKQPMAFKFFDEGQDFHTEITGSIVRLTSHTYNQGRPQLQVEIEQSMS